MNRLNTSIVIKARRTELTDAQEIIRFVNRSTLEIFGHVKGVGKIHEFIEKAILAVTLEDEVNKRLLAQACFYDYPNVNSVKQHDWESWIKRHYKTSKLNSLNTLFLHFFACQADFSIASIQEIIRAAFKAVPECHYIVLCVPDNSIPDSTLASVFNEFKHDEKPQDCVLFLAKREKHVPVLNVRIARVNDNDDLVPLFNTCTEVLKATYGDYYVAELIEAQNEDNKCLASEANDLAMGFMALTTDVNLGLLNDCFELGPFHGMHKPHDDDVLSQPLNIQEHEKDNANVKGAFQNQDEPIIESKISENYQEIVSNENDKLSTRSSSSTSSVSVGSYKPQTSLDTFVPHYAGASNAFAIQLFCIDEKYESRSCDFLKYAFQCFPERDYCIITLPHNVPEFTLIQNFIRVTPRPKSTLNHELYLFHRAGLLKEFNVRYADEKDLHQVEKLVAKLSTNVHLLNDLKEYLTSRKDNHGVRVEAFVAEVLGQIVGIAFIKQEEDIEYLRSNYNIEDFVYFSHHQRNEHGRLKRFALNPIFSFMTKHFIKEILRKSYKTCLYYPVYPKYVNPKVHNEYSLTNAMNFMVPIRHRPQITYNFDVLRENAPSNGVLESKYMDFPSLVALNHINRKLVLEPKITINIRIVVIGASETALSFLETLAFSPHLRFNNLTLVSEKGLNDSLGFDSIRNRMLPKSLNYEHADHARMSLRSWVNVAYGKITAIDRKNKQIHINSTKILPYDHLVLCTGEQYYRVAPTDAKVFNFYTKNEVKTSFDRILFDVPPPNYFVINDDHDAENLIYFIKKHKIHQENKKIIFYGLDLNVYCAIQALLDLEIDPKRILIILPNDDENSTNNCLNDSHVKSIVQQELAKLGIVTHHGYYMKEWNNGKWNAGTQIHSIKFSTFNTKDKQQVELGCSLLLCFYKKEVDYNTFISTNQASLVFDGRLVIDNTFHTNDSCIRSAGTMTKYKRSYYVDEWTHKCFNSKDVGFDLACKMLQQFDPTIAHDEERNETQELLIPLYKSPKKIYAVLPSGLHYLSVTKPGTQESIEEAKKDDNHGQEFVTNTNKGYFKIHINQYRAIETITCLSRNKIPFMNYQKLYGLHERFLNNLSARYQQGLIKDFFDFFNESWSVAIFHDRFSDLCEEISEILRSNNNGLKSMEEFISDKLDNDLILAKDERAQVKDYFKQSGAKRLVELRLLKYLNYNSNHLPMYAKPDMV